MRKIISVPRVSFAEKVVDLKEIVESEEQKKLAAVLEKRLGKGVVFSKPATKPLTSVLKKADLYQDKNSDGREIMSSDAIEIVGLCVNGLDERVVSNSFSQFSSDRNTAWSKKLSGIEIQNEPSAIAALRKILDDSYEPDQHKPESNLHCLDFFKDGIVNDKSFWIKNNFARITTKRDKSFSLVIDRVGIFPLQKVEGGFLIIDSNKV